MPQFQTYAAIGAQALVTGRVTGGGGSTRVEFRLWDVLPQTQLQGTAYTTTESNWRRIAHIIADAIYERLLGEKGYFDTRIVYVGITGPRGRETKRLAIMDQDGANGRFLTGGEWPVLTPRFSPTRDQICFMSYANNRPRVYLFDLGSGRQSVLGDFQGMTFAPRFSPDGSAVIMSLSRGQGSQIVRVGLSGGGAAALTNSNSIDVSPCYSPDGSQIVFNSDRDGTPQLYIMGASGGGARRISFGNGKYGTPVWSPRGDLIAFTRYGGDEGNFSIGVMHPDGSGERLIAEGWDVEGPTFCPTDASSCSSAPPARPAARARVSPPTSLPSTSPASTSATSRPRPTPPTPPGHPWAGSWGVSSTHLCTAPHSAQPDHAGAMLAAVKDACAPPAGGRLRRSLTAAPPGARGVGGRDEGTAS